MVAKIDLPDMVAARSSEPFTAEVDEITEGGWNSLVEGFADATVYQTWAYGAVCWGEKQLSHIVLKRGSATVAMAQLRIVRAPVIRAGVAYLRWGPLCMRELRVYDPEVWRAMTEAVIQEYVVRRGLLLRVIPHSFQQDPWAHELIGMWSEAGFAADPAIRQYRTMRVCLNPSVDDLRRQLSARWRRQLNIAERNDLEVVEGKSLELYQQFLSLYREMMDRKQFETTVDVGDFERIQQRLPESQKMMVFLCRLEGRPVAGLVVDAIGKTGIYLLAATGDDGLQARGSYLLQWRAMQWLKSEGREWYDLGGVNQEVNPGVFTFKSGMGGEEASNPGCQCLSRSLLSRWTVSAGERIARISARLTQTK